MLPSLENMIDLWLVKFHGLTVAQLIVKEPPELLKSPDWFKKYAVTQAQHDEWYAEAIEILYKRTRLPKRLIKRSFVFDYLNCAPAIINENDYNGNESNR